MNKEKHMKLIKLSGIYFLNKTSQISLSNGQVEIGEDQFIAVGLEKSRTAKNWEDEDYFYVVILAKAVDQNYYLSKIEHPADILAPKYVNDDIRIKWVEENIESEDRLLISNLYSLNDSRCEYTLTIHDKPYSFIEKYIVYTMSASYEIWEINNKSKVEISPFINVRCKFSSHHFASALENTPTKVLEYPIDINSLLKTSIFQYRPFEIWDGKVTEDGLIVTLEPD